LADLPEHGLIRTLLGREHSERGDHQRKGDAGEFAHRYLYKHYFRLV
jgi:hypothetical protein